MPTGSKIKEIRQQKGLTQKQLGDMCGMYESQIRKYETGKANPKIETLQKIAVALGIPLDYLLDSPALIESKISFHNINSVLEILSRAGYNILQVPCLFNSGDWQVRTITPDHSSEPITAAFNDRLAIMSKGCLNYNGTQQYCNFCNRTQLTFFIIEKNKKRFSLTIDEMKKHVDEIVKYVEFIFSSDDSEIEL